MAHAAHRPALEREVGDLDDGLVAELDGRQVQLALEHRRALFAAAHHRRRPRVLADQVAVGGHRARPRLGVADRVAADQGNARDHPVGDRRLPRGRPDDGLVASQREVAQRVTAALPLQQAPESLLVLVAQVGDRCRGPQRDERHDDDGDQEEAEQGAVDDVLEPLAAQLHGAVDAHQRRRDLLDAGPEGRVPQHLARIEVQHRQPVQEGHEQELDGHAHREPPRPRVVLGRELRARCDQQGQQHQGDRRVGDVVALHDVADDEHDRQAHGQTPLAPLAFPQTRGHPEQQQARDRGDRRRRRGRRHRDEVHQGVDAVTLGGKQRVDQGDDTGQQRDRGDDPGGPALEAVGDLAGA